MKKLIVVMAVMMSLTLSACCKPGIQSKWCNVQTAVTDCGSEWLKGKLPGLMGEVTKILEGGSLDYKAQLDAVKVDGVSVAFCAVRKYVELNATPVTPTKSVDGIATKTSALTVKDPAKTLALLRAVDYLGTKVTK